MQAPKIIDRDEIKFIGIEVRTRNSDEVDPATAKIPKLWDRFLSEELGAKTPAQTAPGVTLAVYSDYESDENGEYGYAIGCAVNSLDDVPDGMTAKTIPGGRYARITTGTGMMPGVVIAAWQEIWGMDPERLGGTRRFTTDYEVYDERSTDPATAEVDIYIAVE